MNKGKKGIECIVGKIKNDYGIASRKQIGELVDIKESTLRHWYKEGIPEKFKEPYNVLCLLIICFDEPVEWSEYLKEIKKHTDWSDKQYEQFENILKNDNMPNGLREKLKKCVNRLIEYSREKDIIKKRFSTYLDGTNNDNLKKVDNESDDILEEKEGEKLKNLLIAKGIFEGVSDNIKDPIWLFKVGAQFYLNKKNKDLKVSFLCFERSAELGFAEADHWLGGCYADGIGCEKNLEKAIECYERGAAKGNIDCQLFLGDVYYGKNEEFLSVIKLDYKKSFKWYKEAAERGNVKAKFMVGILHYGGFEGIEKNWEKSDKYFTECIGDVSQNKKCIEKDERNRYMTRAYYCLARIYKEGGNGIEKDLELSELYFNKSYEYYERIQKKLQKQIFKKAWIESSESN